MSVLCQMSNIGLVSVLQKFMIFLLLGKMKSCFGFCVQGNPIDWVSTHRYHHQFCDSEKDPHSPIEGFWFSHMSWLFDTNAMVERVWILSLSRETEQNRSTCFEIY